MTADPRAPGAPAAPALYRYELDEPGLGKVALYSDIRHPRGSGWPPHLQHAKLYDGPGRIRWWVTCSVCQRSTGRTKNRSTLAGFLVRHRRCGAAQ